MSVSAGGRSRTISLAGLDDAQMRREVEAYRQWRQARAKMVRTFTEMLEAVDRLGRVRTVSIERLRHARVRPE